MKKSKRSKESSSEEEAEEEEEEEEEQVPTQKKEKGSVAYIIPFLPPCEHCGHCGTEPCELVATKLKWEWAVPPDANSTSQLRKANPKPVPYVDSRDALASTRDREAILRGEPLILTGWFYVCFVTFNISDMNLVEQICSCTS
jgi:hypothetical protein